MGEKLGLCKRVSRRGRRKGGGTQSTFLLFFHQYPASHYFFMVFLNSFWGFQKQYYKTKLINKAHSIVWFERRHHLMCTWLISICCSNVWFAEFPIYRKKIPHPVPKLWRILLPGLNSKIPFLVKISCIFPNLTLYFGQIPDPKNTAFRPCSGRQLRRSWKTKDFQGVWRRLYFSRYFWDSGEEQWKIQGTGLGVSVKKSVNMYHVRGQIMG